MLIKYLTFIVNLYKSLFLILFVSFFTSIVSAKNNNELKNWYKLTINNYYIKDTISYYFKKSIENNSDSVLDFESFKLSSNNVESQYIFNYCRYRKSYFRYIKCYYRAIMKINENSNDLFFLTYRTDRAGHYKAASKKNTKDLINCTIKLAHITDIIEIKPLDHF